MNWKRRFPSIILNRGREYFRQRRVKELKVTGDSARALVEGRKMYMVAVQGLTTGQLQYKCSCPSAREGYRCKHIAAVLYHYEAVYGPIGTVVKPAVKTIPAKEIFPPTQERKAAYFQFHNMMRDIEIPEDTFLQGKTLFENKALTLSRFETRYEEYLGDDQIRAEAVARITDLRDTNVVAHFGRNHIDRIYCQTCRQGVYDDPDTADRPYCAHMAAMFYLLDQYIRFLDPGDETDAAGHRFLEDSSRWMAAEQAGQERKRAIIRLVPRVTRTYEGNYLSFRIGKDRLYVLKSFSELVKSVQRAGSMTLGKSQELDLRTETFTPDSEAYYRLIEQAVHDREETVRSMMEGFELPADTKSEVGLSGRVLDEFYETAKGQEVEFQDKVEYFSQKAIVLEERPLAITLRIEPKVRMDRFLGIAVYGELPRILRGRDYYYTFDNRRISRIRPEEEKKVRPLLDLSENGGFRFTIGKKNMRRFYYQTLPSLRESSQVDIIEEEPELIAANLLPEAHFAFYLDLEEGIPVCRVQAWYEEERFALKPLTAAEAPPDARRDLEEEDRIRRAVEEFFPQYDPAKEQFFCDSQKDTLIEDMHRAVEKLLPLGEVHATDAIDRMKIRKMPAVRFGLSIEGSMLDLEISS